jgi:hypothetical protein
MSVTINLEEDEALVIFELIASGVFKDAVDAPERNALEALEALLEKELVAPFSPDYKKLLQSARKSLVERYGE